MVKSARRRATTQPFLKWAGGKRWLAPAIKSLVTIDPGRYYEPFVGSGAIFFSLAPYPATLADANLALVTTFRAVRDEPEAVCRKLQQLHPTKDAFERVRRSKPRSATSIAARFIYLNRTSYNGLYRLNQRGEFNVPFAFRSTTRVCDTELLQSCSSILKGRKLVHAEFGDTLATASTGDTVYIDPPYTIAHNNNGFRGFNERLFRWEDQVKLARLANHLAASRVHVVVSNACHAPLLRLYSSFHFQAFSIQRLTAMSGSAGGRGQINEALIVSRSIAERGTAKELIANALSRDVYDLSLGK